MNEAAILESQLPAGVPGELTRIGWKLPDDLTEDQWRDAGRALKGAEGAMLWWVGDWAAAGDHRYGRLKEVSEQVEFDYATVNGAAWVSRAFPEFVRRRTNVPWSHHREVASLPPAEADALLEWCASGVDDGKGGTRCPTKQELRKRRTALPLPGDATPPPDGTYDVIVIDPPWEMEKIQRDVRPNQAGFDYPTMDEAALMTFGAEVVTPLAGEACHLFCWTTHKHLPMSLRLIEAWGFSYVLTMVWHKPGGFQPVGLPQYNCEFVIYARRGAPKFVDLKAFPVCFNAPRREHSRKPDEFYDLVRRVTEGRRIDIFSRESRDEFDQYGNEVGKFAAAA